MADLNVTHDIVVGDQRSAAKLQQNFVDIESKINGNLQTSNIADLNVTADKISSAAATQLGLSQAGAVRSGVSVIATEETRSSTSYGTMTTPDRVQNVVVPTNGTLCFRYQALMKSSVNGASSVAVFIGANQLKAGAGGSAPLVSSGGAVTTDYDWVYTTPGGWSLQTGAGDASSVTTGLIMIGGGSMEIDVAAGTYDVSVQFKSTSGSMTVKERKLWVRALGF